jgi:hypothetical protein
MVNEMSKSLSKPKNPQPECPGAKPSKVVTCKLGDTDQESYRNLAMLATSPALAAYRVVTAAEHNSGLGDLIDAAALIAQLCDQAAEVNGGSLAQAEAMLMNQATALQSLFSRLAERAMRQDQIPQFEANMRMALRAQNQCRMTLETLATIKNPPVFAKQANIAHGPQQVNNGTVPPVDRARTGQFESEPNKLLEANNGERMDTRTQGTASGANQELETVGAIHRAENRDR